MQKYQNSFVRIFVKAFKNQVLAEIDRKTTNKELFCKKIFIQLLL